MSRVEKLKESLSLESENIKEDETMLVFTHGRTIRALICDGYVEG